MLGDFIKGTTKCPYPLECFIFCRNKHDFYVFYTTHSFFLFRDLIHKREQYFFSVHCQTPHEIPWRYLQRFCLTSWSTLSQFLLSGKKWFHPKGGPLSFVKFLIRNTCKHLVFPYRLDSLTNWLKQFNSLPSAQLQAAFPYFLIYENVHSC